MTPKNKKWNIKLSDFDEYPKMFAWMVAIFIICCWIYG